MLNSHKHYVIIGGSAAGMAAAEVIRKLDAKAPILVLSQESHLPYFRPLIPFLISRKKRPTDLLLKGHGPYQERDITVRINTRVEKVETSEQRILLQSGERIPYDRLLIASGSRPAIPACAKNKEIKGVFTFRTIADAEAIAQWVKSDMKVVLLGAGLTNLKAASALLEVGAKVTMVELENEILPWVMEPDAVSLIREALTQAGMKLITGRTASQILFNEQGVSGILLDDGQRLPCEMFCIGIGVQPNVEFLAQSGIDVDQGILVNQFTESNIQNVYAAGDVASTFDPITGKRIVSAQWTNAVEMGRCAGRNMADLPTAHAGSFGVLNATQVANVPFVAMGIVHTSGTDYETHVTRTEHTYGKLVFSADDSRLIGANFVGDISRAGLYRYIIRERMPTESIKSDIIRHKLHYGHFLRS